MRIDVQEVKDYISKQSAETKVYFGADSERINVDNRWCVDYLLVIAVHVDGKHGAKVFGQIERERDFDTKLDRPKLRLMTEVYKIAELYMQFEEFLENRHVEIHLDISPMNFHGSNCAFSEAIGYVKGVCGKDPVVKPYSWCATNVADSVKRIISS